MIQCVDAQVPQSVTSYPYNWSAWLDLSTMITDWSECKRRQLPAHWIKIFFEGSFLLALHLSEDAERIYTELLRVFPKSSFVIKQQALASYYNRGEMVKRAIERSSGPVYSCRGIPRLCSVPRAIFRGIPDGSVQVCFSRILFVFQRQWRNSACRAASSTSMS